MDQELVQYLDERFGRLDERFDRVDERFVRIEQRLDNHDHGLLGLKYDWMIITTDLMRSSAIPASSSKASGTSCIS